MNVKELYDYVNYIARKSPYGNVLGPDEYNNLLPVVAFEFAKRYYTPSQTQSYYQPVTLPPTEVVYPRASAVNDKLTPLRTTTGEIVIVPGTPTAKPEDYWHHSSVYVTDATPGPVLPEEWYLVDVISESQAGYRIRSAIIKKEIQNSFAYMAGDEFFFTWDDLLTFVKIDYLRRPKTPYMTYTIDPVTLEIIYDDLALTTVQFDWADDVDAMDEIGDMLLTKFGISMRDQSIVQWSELQKQQ